MVIHIQGTHYLNASLLNKTYIYSSTLRNIDSNPITNKIKFL